MVLIMCPLCVYLLKDGWSQLRWLEVASLASGNKTAGVNADVRNVTFLSFLVAWLGGTFKFYGRSCFLFFSDGGSDDSSSDSDGGPGFFDGINDNPSEEAFLAATTKKALGGRALLVGGEEGGAGLGASDGGDDDDDDSSETADPADERASSDGGHTSVASPASAAPGKRKGVGNGGGLDGDDETSGRRSAADGGRSAGTGTGAESCEDRATKRIKCGAEQQGAGEREREEEGGKNTGGPPANFSRVDPSLPRAELAKRFPQFVEAECCTVEVEAGQMLYLPAGWFHEVRCEVASGCAVVPADRCLLFVATVGGGSKAWV